jgi:acyl-CoA reductase-like NAD-dependent aldehyde dehydrogenase
MVKLKELHPQYITDEEGRRTSVILPIVEFEQLIAAVKDLADVAESQEKSIVEQAISLSQRRAYLKLPPEERRRHLAAQADRMVEHYEQVAERTEREAWQGGDIVEP